MVSYKAELEKIDRSVQWLMTLYLHPDVTPAEIRKAAKAGIKGQSSCCSGSRRRRVGARRMDTRTDVLISFSTMQVSSPTLEESLPTPVQASKITKSTTPYSRRWRRKAWS